MVQQLFKENTRRSTVIKILKTHVPKSVEDIKDVFKKINQPLQFGDDAIHEWLIGITGIERIKCRDNFMYTMVNNLQTPKRRNVSPLPDEHSPKRHMIEFSGTRITSTVIRDKKRTEPLSKRACQNCQPLQVDPPHLHSVKLIGDDFFLNMAVFEMKFESKSVMRVRQSGNCVSGLRISGATRRIMQMRTPCDVIINVGSVDIAEGRQLIEMIEDFHRLLTACRMKDISPILTTLAPLPGHMLGNKHETWRGFNDFIRLNLSEHFSIIDIHKAMIRPDGVTDYNMYQAEPRFISGSCQPFVMWNKQGRTRVNNMLMKNLGLTMIYDNYVGEFI